MYLRYAAVQERIPCRCWYRWWIGTGRIPSPKPECRSDVEENLCCSKKPQWCGESGMRASGELCHGMSLHVFSLKSSLSFNKVRVAFTYVSRSCIAAKFLNRVTLRDRVTGVKWTMSWLSRRWNTENKTREERVLLSHALGASRAFLSGCLCRWRWVGYKIRMSRLQTLSGPGLEMRSESPSTSHWIMRASAGMHACLHGNKHDSNITGYSCGHITWYSSRALFSIDKLDKTTPRNTVVWQAKKRTPLAIGMQSSCEENINLFNQ